MYLFIILIYPLVHVYKGIQNLFVMEVIVKISTYATHACGTSVDCPNLQLTSQGWVAKFGTIKSVATQADEPNLHWLQPTVIFNMSVVEMTAANKFLDNWWYYDTIQF